MIRATLCCLALAIVPAGLAQADDAKNANGQDKHHMQAMITKVDAQNHEITVKMTDKDGKQETKTLQLATDAKIVNAAGKDIKLDAFKAGDDVCLTKKNDKVTEVKKHAMATITKVDGVAGTVTVKMQDKDGKEVERTFRLVEDSEYVDSTGRVAVLDIFQSGDDILFVEANGTIKGMKKADDKHAATANKTSDSKAESK